MRTDDVASCDPEVVRGGRSGVHGGLHEGDAVTAFAVLNLRICGVYKTGGTCTEDLTKVTQGSVSCVGESGPDEPPVILSRLSVIGVNICVRLVYFKLSLKKQEWWETPSTSTLFCHDKIYWTRM